MGLQQSNQVMQMPSRQDTLGGGHLRTVGHKKYDRLLKGLMEEVRQNTSREDLIAICLDGLVEVSTASGFAVLELAALERTDEDSEATELRGYDQRRINTDRWQRFRTEHLRPLNPGSIIYEVIEDGIEVDVWSTTYLPDRFQPLKPLFDVEDGGWLAALQLPRATAQHNSRGIFVWYKSASGEKVPPGAEQDWRFLKLFQLCYDMAGFSIRKAARSILVHRQELLSVLAPSIMTHEINTCIRQIDTVLVQMLEDIEKLRARPQVRESAAMKRELGRMANNLNEILLPTTDRLKKFSESVMGLTTRRRQEEGTCEPREVIESAVQLVTRRAKRDGVSIAALETATDSVRIRTDPALLMHAVVNLLVNSIQALSEQERTSFDDDKLVEVKLRSEKSGEGGQAIYIDVIDNGPGIPVALKESVFEPGITTKDGGHGLGLPICKTIAHYLGGELAVESLKDPTIFRLRLPLESSRIADLEEELKAEGDHT